MSNVSVAPGPRISSGCARIASATALALGRLLEPREHRRHPLERQGEREDAAAVDGGRDRVLVDARRVGDVAQVRALHAVALEPVALLAPAVRAADGEHPGVLAGAVVLEPRGRVALRAALEVVLARVRAREQHPDGVELLGPGEVRRRGDRELPRVGVVVGARERQRLERLRRGARERDERRVAGLDDLRPSRTATAWTRCVASTTSPRRTTTLMGSEPWRTDVKCPSFPRWRPGGASSTSRCARFRSRRPVRRTSRR